MIIDIDSHFEPGADWLDPYPDLAKRLPKVDPALLAVHTIVGDLLRDVPEADRPPVAELLPPGLLTLFGEEKAGEAARRAEFAGKQQFQKANASARVKWLDEQGIARQNVICLSGIAQTLFLDDRALRQETLAASNSWLADTCDEANGRLLPVTVLEFEDVDWIVRELTRMRGRGSRIFLIPGYPVNGVPPTHPSWDRVWSAATGLGMAPMLHTGFEHTRIDSGWANSGADVTFLGVGWLPFLYREIDDRISPTAELFVGTWKYPMKPSEYLARNVRGTPLSAGNDSPIAKIIEELPDDMIVFSSDFPHFEGFTDPIGHYAKVLADLKPERRARFFGGAIADVYARMGDPIA
jgi:predicted TIM-barrel fold metal-dependent hydrolase